MKVLLFQLEGLLQSWGECAHWDVRDTGYFPTKSAIVGLICSCLGWSRDDPRISDLNRQIILGVRADRAGTILADFHTVQGKPRLATAGGGFRAESKSTIVSRRYYLQDASFLVGISGDEKVLKMISDALLHPVYTIFLGRKACIPSIPVIPQIMEFSSIEEAFEHVRISNRIDGSDLFAEFDASAGAAGFAGSRNDLINNFSDRDFRERNIVRKTIHLNA